MTRKNKDRDGVTTDADHEDEAAENGQKNSSDYEVGYSRPPKNRQFKPGKSGNLKGRPKGSRNLKTDLDAALKARIKVMKDGRPVHMSTQQVIIARLIEKSLKGDIRAQSKLFDLTGTYLKDEEEQAIEKPLSRTDAQILSAFKDSLDGTDDQDVPTGTVKDETLLSDDTGGDYD